MKMKRVIYIFIFMLVFTGVQFEVFAQVNPQRKPAAGGDEVKVNALAKERITFKFGGSELDDNGVKVVKGIYEVVSKCPTSDIKIVGHTDSMGDKKLNEELSYNRAKSVAEYLVLMGAGRGRLEVFGYGESRPVANNNTREGRALNRRVEFIVLGE